MITTDVRQNHGMVMISNNNLFVPLYFDITLSENHKLEGEITKHPVEKGLAITDNVRLEPVFLKATCGFASLVFYETNYTNRVSDKYEQLILMRESKEIFTVQTSLRAYDNMVIESIEIPRSPGEIYSLFFDITLRQIVYANAVSVLVPEDILATTAAGGASTINNGRQTAEEVSEEEEEKAKSFLFRITGQSGVDSAINSLSGI